MHLPRTRIALSAVAVLFAASLAGCTGGGGGSPSGCSTDLKVTTPEGDFTANSAKAASLVDGAGYTAYAGDFEVDANDVTALAGPTPPSGSHLVTIAITRFNATTTDPIEAGTTVPAQADVGELTYVVTVNSDAGINGNSTDASGDLTVTSVGDTLCFEVDYTDTEKSVKGTVSAAVKPL
jgi:hypothetical protein